MLTHITRDPAAAIAHLGALLLIAASAALGTTYAYALGAHFGPWVAYAFAAMALGGEFVKPVAIERAFAHGLRRPVSALVCLAVASVAIAYSLTAELGFSAGARGDLAAERADSLARAHEAKAAAKRASDELAGLKPARSVGELEVLVANAKPVCRMVVTHGFRGDVCSKPAGLTSELARAKRRAELEGKIAEAAKVGAGVGEADPQAAALVAYLAAVGVTVTQERLATWLHLLPVLLLEVGSAFGLLVAGGGQRLPAARATVAASATVAEPAPAPMATVAQQLPATVAEAHVRPATVATVASGPRPASRQPLPEAKAVLEALARAGRPMSNDELAAALGVHKGTASKRVKALGPAIVKVRQGREVALSLAPAVH